MIRTVFVVIVIALIGVYVLPRLLLANVFWRRRGRDFFPHAVRSLLLGMANGAELRVRVRGSPVKLRLKRCPGLGENSALVVVVVPSAEWSDSVADAVRSAFQAHGFAVLPDQETRTTEAVCARVPVPDIWEAHSGSPGARAALVALDAMGVAEDARFILDLEGERSTRVFKRVRQGEPLET